MTVTSTRELLHAEILPDAVPGRDLLFVTVFLPLRSGAIVRVEHHVFIEAEARHLHTIAFLNSAEAASPRFLRTAIAGSHQLLADHTPASDGGAAGGRTYLTRTVDDLARQLAPWRNRPKLAGALARLPDVTASATLRALGLR